MTISRKKFEGEQKHGGGKNLEGAPFKPSFGLGGVVDLVVDLAVDLDVAFCKSRVAHICPLLANVGNTNAGSRGFAFV
jgi:hypothetical protein